MSEVRERCFECDGEGRVEVEYVRGYGPNAYLAYRWEVCEDCGGRGSVAEEDDEDGDE